MPAAEVPRSTQVLIVGGGPAGATTAWFCAHAGLQVTLLDRAHFPRPKPCAEYVSPEATRILAALGALDAIDAQASRLTGMRVHAPSGVGIQGEFVASHGFRGFRDHGLGVRREVLDATLLDRARSVGVEVCEGVKVENVVRDHQGRAVGVHVRTAAGQATVNASLIIGADGLRSIVSHRLHLAHASRWCRRVALVTHFRDVAELGTLGEMHVTPSGYVGLADVGGGLCNVALVVPFTQARAMAGCATEFMHDWLRGHPTLGPRFRAATCVAPVRVTGPFASQAHRAWSPGAALVGDAADFFDPFTGEGIYAAMRGGELLAPFAVDALAAIERRDLRAELRALRAYDRARHAAFAGKWRIERLVALAVAVPALMNGAARVLSRDRTLGDLLVGVTGDFIRPSALCSPPTLRRLGRALLDSVLHARRAPDAVPARSHS